MNKLGNLNIRSITYNEILLGTKSTWNPITSASNVNSCIDTLLTIYKKTLIDMKENKRILSEHEIEKMIVYRIELEKNILDQKRFKTKWMTFIHS